MATLVARREANGTARLPHSGANVLGLFYLTAKRMFTVERSGRFVPPGWAA